VAPGLLVDEPMVLRNRRRVVATFIVLLGSSMLACTHRGRSVSPKLAVLTRPGQVDKPTSSPKVPKAQENIDRSQGKLDEAVKKPKSGARARSVRAVGGSVSPPDTDTQQPMFTNGNQLPSYGVVILTQPTPAAEKDRAAVRSVASESPVGLVRDGGRLRSRTATLIFVALIAAIVGLPLLRRRYT
jgi:hypothetical protein